MNREAEMNEDAGERVPLGLAYPGEDETEPELPRGFELVGRVVHWKATPSFSDLSALLEPHVEVKPGQLLGVWHGRRERPILTVMQVVGCFEENPNETPDLAAARGALGLVRGYADEGVSTRIYRVAEGPTLEEFDVSEDGQVTGEGRSPELLARAGDPVVLLPAEIALRTLGVDRPPDEGVHLGSTLGATPATVTFSPQVLQLHIGVFGNPGKGKSYLTGNILEEAVRWNIPCLVLDVNGELIAAAEALGGKVITLPDRGQFGLSLDHLTSRELVAVTPNVQAGTNYAELIELAHDRLKTSLKPGERITFEKMNEFITEHGEQTKVTALSIKTAIARLRGLQHDPLIGDNFDFVAQVKAHGIVLLDCRFVSLRSTQLIAAAAARELQRAGSEMARKAEAGDEGAAKWFALYFVDEAHAVIPDDDKVVSTQIHLELARMGRHVRTGMVLSSQSPQDLNPSVLKRVQTRFIFALERDQLRSIQGVHADLDERVIAQLPKLERGVCAVSGSGELVRHGFLMRVRARKTPVRGRTPDIFAARAKRPLSGRSNG